MSNLLHIDLATLVQLVGYPGMFVIIFLESGIFFGFFLPGASLLFTAGILASVGLFDIWLLVPLLALAGILGDTVGFWTGSWLGEKLYNRPDSRWFKKKHINETHAFFDQHGPKAIFLARFVPVVRTFIPIVAGAARMHYATFLRWNILGGIIWTSALLLAGYGLGRSIPSAEQYLFPISIVIVIVSLIPLFLEWLGARKAARRTPSIVLFDLDNTLAPPTTPLPPKMADRLTRLLATRRVAIMTDAGLPRIRAHVLPTLAHANLKNLYLFPDVAASGYTYEQENGTWNPLYQNSFTPAEREQIITAMKKSIEATGILHGIVTQGEHIMEYDGHIIFTALGIDASSDEKTAWDPTGAKRQTLKASLEKELPGFHVRIGGRTSVNVAQPGITKAYGVRRLSKFSNTPIRDMLYIGDEFSPEGNDTPVRATGIRTIETSGPEETAKIIDGILTKLT